MLENHRDPVLNTDTSLNLALKYRPKSFKTVVGQQHIITILRQGVQDRTIPQQILFTGGSGLGKTTLARILSSALLCERAVTTRDRGDACGECSSCVDILTYGRSHPDVIEIDAASNGGKEEIREIASRAQLVPSRGALKIYIIDEAHGLSGPGGQAFLKLLEEPPAHVVFMLCTTDPEKMLKTNRGRCLELEMVRPTEKELSANLERVCLAEGWQVTDQVLNDIIRATDKDIGIRGTLMTLGKVSSALSPEGVDLNLLYEILGLPSSSSVNSIFTAIDSGNPLTAVDNYAKLRERSNCKIAHLSMLAKARERWLNSLKSNDSEKYLREYRLLVETKVDDSYIEIAIAKMTRRDLDEVYNNDAKDITEEAKLLLTSLISTMNDCNKTINIIQENIKILKDEHEILKINKTVKKQKNKPSEKNAGAIELPLQPLAKEVSAFTLLVAQLTAAASPTTPDFKSFISKCAITTKGDSIIVSVPTSIQSALALHRETLQRAATRLGYDIKID
ncbi:MAG: AAA family ATPase [Candidatus Paceibacterota bacterium]